MIEILPGNGIAVRTKKDIILLDPKVSDFYSFVSHAHQDHLPEIILKKPFCTKETYELIKVRDPYFEANIVEENKKIKFDNFSVEFVGAGHILGSSQIFLELDGFTILYSGDVKSFDILTANECKIKEADILIVESTYGLPIYKFPNVEEIIRDLENFIRKNETVNLIGYQLGKSQDIVKMLNEIGIEPTVSKSVEIHCKIYNKFGKKLKFTNEKTNIFVRPTSILKKFIGKENSAIFTGWSLTQDLGLYGFPFSDHNDFYQMLEYISQVNPKKVYVVHGFEKEFAKEIEERLNIEAISLSSLTFSKEIDENQVF